MQDRTGTHFDTMSELVDCILEEHHDFLRNELTPLGDELDALLQSHASTYPELKNISEAFDALQRDVPAHLAQEEQILFPAVRKLDDETATETERQTAHALLSNLVDEHDETLSHLADIRAATDDFSPPSDAPDRLESMYDRLHELHDNLRLHIHRENDLLFEAFKSTDA